MKNRTTGKVQYRFAKTPTTPERNIVHPYYNFIGLIIRITAGLFNGCDSIFVYKTKQP